MDRVAVFVDVQNVFYTVKQSHGCHFAFWDKATAGREVVRAYAYAIDRRDPKQIRFQQILEPINFRRLPGPTAHRSAIASVEREVCALPSALLTGYT